MFIYLNKKSTYKIMKNVFCFTKTATDVFKIPENPVNTPPKYVTQLRSWI